MDTTTGIISGTIAANTSANSPYTVEVTVTDDGAQSKSTKITFTWNVTSTGMNQAPIAIITADEIAGDAPFKVFFSGSKSTDDIGIVSYLWDFKDGMTSDAINPSHVFETPGTYAVELTVSDGSLTHTATLIITVNEKGGKIRAVIRPNPATEFAKVYVLNATSKNVVREIQLHDAAGKYISTISNPELVNGYYRVPVYAMQEGVYYMTLHMQGSSKLVVGFVVKN
ncbi:PKD domain-containing protein [Gelidibacter sp. F2691]|nr:PKD domain-containing protein [Gelidibacter sp. F2691]